MKLPKLPRFASLLSVSRSLRRIAVALESIAEAQQRQANLLEGIEPLRESPPAPDDPPRLESLIHPPGYFERQEQIETWFLAHHHRPPSPEELVREMEGIPWGAEEFEEALSRKWARTREQARPQ